MRTKRYSLVWNLSANENTMQIPQVTTSAAMYPRSSVGSQKKLHGAKPR